jgi:GTP-binding protein
MAFVDELKIFAKAGDGGNGVVRWRHEKFREFGGPSGGNGGRGGSVYLLAVRDIHLLSKYRNQKEFVAEKGEDGKGNSEHGFNGKDLEIALPIGSVVENLKTGKKIFLEKEGERTLLLSGGMGGRGNESFKGSTNQQPKEWTPGSPGEEADFFIEIQLVADIGLIGFPNAGKTSLLNELTRASGKVGAYPFTTLEPNLGECHGYILSDIPGLIEGASEGKGLGHKFLRHVKRTKLLVHLVSLENEDPIAVYRSIRKELEQYDLDLPSKKEVVILTKTDLIKDPASLKKTVAKMQKIVPTVFTLSIYDDAQIKNLQDALLKEVKK